ncbi:MAG: cupin domain-containing protein [Pseudomonadota bacterium]
MNEKSSQLIKNIAFSTPVKIVDLVDYEDGRVVSRTLSSKPHVNITLFAFDKGEEISAHTSPGDAMVQILDGEALINVDGKEIKAGKGEVVVMPANVPHAVSACSRFKMLLTVVKQIVGIGTL